jgi:hypothetical protein
MNWEGILKTDLENRDWIKNEMSQFKQALFDNIAPHWEEEPMLLQKFLDETFTDIMQHILGGTAQSLYHGYKYGRE